MIGVQCVLGLLLARYEFADGSFHLCAVAKSNRARTQIAPLEPLTNIPGSVLEPTCSRAIFVPDSGFSLHTYVTVPLNRPLTSDG